MVELILIMLGLFFTGVDIFIAGPKYPVYEMTRDLGEVIQEFITGNVLSDHLKIDIFPDFIGCILLFIGTCMCIKYSKCFFKGQLFIVTTALLSIALRAIPFYINGEVLVVTELLIYFMMVASELYMEFLIIYAMVSISDDTANQARNTRIQFGWWVTVFCRVFIGFLTFVGHITVTNVYKAVLVPATLFYLYHMFHTRKFIGSTKRSSMTWKKRLLK